MNPDTDNSLVFIPLGGSDEIGMNLNLYGFKGYWIIVDIGITFAGNQYPGIDVLLPDPSFLLERRNQLQCILLTHAHEDHLGAVPYLWENLRCPVYATSYTAAVLRKKLVNVGLEDEVPIVEIAYQEKFDLGPFEITYGGITHSIPEASILSISTSAGLIVHSGDWKIDSTPLVGLPTDELFLKDLGDRGVNTLICDSTNVFRPGMSGSELSVRHSLNELVNQCVGRVIIGTFASNIARIETIANIAKQSNRKLVISGRSLWNSIETAQSCGYLTDLPPLLNESEALMLPSNSIVMLCTGCQGESRASLSRISFGKHSISLDHKDTVILSSKIIPGNERLIGDMINRFVRMNVNVITERESLVHVSGHPARDELKHLYDLLRPKSLVPVHGEAVHIHEHCRYAEELGVRTTIPVKNGDVVHVAPKPAHIVDNVSAGRLLVDGKQIISENSEVMRQRRRIMNNGVIFVTLLTDNQGVVFGMPVVCSVGVVDNSYNLECDLANNLSKMYRTKLSKKRFSDVEIRQIINRVVRDFSEKKPIVIVKMAAKSIN